MPTKPSQSEHEALRLESILALLNERSQPNVNALNEAIRSIPWANLNIKTFGYDLARRLALALPTLDQTAPRHVGLKSKVSVQADMEGDWVRHWCSKLQTPLLYHRKLWELSYVLQAIHENGLMREHARGLGFGCGVEPIPSLLASCGVAVTMTDLEADLAHAAGWASTNQHASSIEAAFHAHLVDRPDYDRLVSLRYVDMNHIPSDLDGYDFCWSICALEHLGSIDLGLKFIENSLKTLKPGGIAIHTTELNIDSEGPTIDNWPTVLFQRRHIEHLCERLTREGHIVAELDFGLGDGPMDRFIDLPPYHHDLPTDISNLLGAPQHLKVAIDGFACSCFGIVIRKAA